jgi:hypothetical protein
VAGARARLCEKAPALSQTLMRPRLGLHQGGVVIKVAGRMRGTAEVEPAIICESERGEARRAAHMQRAPALGTFWYGAPTQVAAGRQVERTRQSSSERSVLSQ